MHTGKFHYIIRVIMKLKFIVTPDTVSYYNSITCISYKPSKSIKSTEAKTALSNKVYLF